MRSRLFWIFLFWAYVAAIILLPRSEEWRAPDIPTARAQRTDTIFQTVVQNFTTTGVTSAVRNIGQSQHQATIQFTDKPSQTCPVTVGVALVYFEGSFDGTTYFPVGYPADSIIGSQASISAQGAYPFLRINLADFPTAACNATVRYSGTLFPMTGEQGRGLITGPKRTNIGLIDTTAMGPSVIIPDNPVDPVNFPTCIFGIFLNVSAATVVTLDGTFGPMSLAANQTITIGFAGSLLYRDSGDVSISQTGTAQLSGFIRYAYCPASEF